MINPDAVRAIAHHMIAELPETLRDELRGVRVVVMARPTEELVEDGCEMGEAGAYIVRGEEEMPLSDGFTDEKPDRAIYLFTANIRPADAGGVRQVFLHELAHACGLDEDEVADMLAADADTEDDATADAESAGAM